MLAIGTAFDPEHRERPAWAIHTVAFLNPCGLVVRAGFAVATNTLERVCLYVPDVPYTNISGTSSVLE